MKETYEAGGIPLTVIKKETVQAKKTRDNEIKKKEVLQTLNKRRNHCLFKINHQHPNHHRKIRAKTRTRSNV